MEMQRGPGCATGTRATRHWIGDRFRTMSGGMRDISDKGVLPNFAAGAAALQARTARCSFMCCALAPDVPDPILLGVRFDCLLYVEFIMSRSNETLERLALTPLLAAQALWVIARAQRLPEPDGARSGATVGASDEALRVFIFGDSSAAGVGVENQRDALSGQLAAALAPEMPVHWHLNARTGRTSRAALQAAEEETRPCDIAVMALGVNDATRLVPTARWLDMQDRLRARLRGLGARRIYVSGVPPLHLFPLLPQPLRRILGARAQAYDAALRETLEQTPDCTYIPLDFPNDPALMATDGFHPNARLYRLWAERLAVAIRHDHLPHPEASADGWADAGKLVDTAHAI